jgi:hypothetical protein
MKIKTFLLKVLTDLNVMKGSTDILQKTIRRLKVGFIDSTNSAVNTQCEANSAWK